MKLLYVTDNGFSSTTNGYRYSAPNYAHMDHLSKYFSEFCVVARNDSNENGYLPIDSKYRCSIHLYDKKDVIGIKKFIRNEIDKVDAVICYGTNGYMASKIAKKKNKVVIAYSGGDPYVFLLSRRTLKGYMLAPIGLYTHKMMFKNADFGHYCDDFLFKRYPASGRMMACSGVSIDYNYTVLEKRIGRIENFNFQKFKIGLIGHTKNNLKGIDIAIKSIGLLGERYELEVVGRGEHSEYDRLAEECSCLDRVRFLGTLSPGHELFEWLDTVDIYIQPSRIEGLPRATIEAMSRGCPVVAANAGAMEKLVAKEYIVPIENVELLTEKIREISNKDKMLIYAKKNFEHCYEYSTENRDRKYDVFYNEVINECKKRNGLLKKMN